MRCGARSEAGPRDSIIPPCLCLYASLRRRFALHRRGEKPGAAPRPAPGRHRLRLHPLAPPGRWCEPRRVRLSDRATGASGVGGGGAGPVPGEAPRQVFRRAGVKRTVAATKHIDKGQGGIIESRGPASDRAPHLMIFTRRLPLYALASLGGLAATLARPLPEAPARRAPGPANRSIPR